MKEMIMVEKEVYEAVLRNSVRVNDLEAENQQLKELLKECYKMLAQYHVENSEPSLDENIQLLTKIDNAIGEKNNVPINI